jgi:hypothetical protein
MSPWESWNSDPGLVALRCGSVTARIVAVAREYVLVIDGSTAFGNTSGAPVLGAKRLAIAMAHSETPTPSWQRSTLTPKCFGESKPTSTRTKLATTSELSAALSKLAARKLLPAWRPGEPDDFMKATERLVDTHHFQAPR